MTVTVLQSLMSHLSRVGGDCARQPDDTPEYLLTSLIKRTGLRQTLKRGARPFLPPPEINYPLHRRRIYYTCIA